MLAGLRLRRLIRPDQRHGALWGGRTTTPPGTSVRLALPAPREDPVSPSAGTPVTLGAVVDALGADVLRVLVAPAGLDVVVGDAVVHDPSGPPAADPGDLVLAVGVDPSRASAVDVVARYGALGASAVLVRTDDPLPPALLVAATGAGVAVLAAPRDAAWGQLHTLLRTARSAHGQGGSGTGIGDLFALADAVAALVGGAATVEDEQSVVLAYSSTDHPVDEGRRDTILGRRVPAAYLQRLHDEGVFRQLWATDDVVRVSLAGLADRLAVAVRAGGEVLGSLWVQEGVRPLGPDAERALREAASMAALHLLRARSGDDLERRRSGEQLRAVLDGRRPPAVLAELLQLAADDQLVVLAMACEGDEPVVVDRAVDLLVMACRAFRRRVVAVALGGTAYAVLTARETDTRALAADLTARTSTGLRTPMRSCVTDLVDGLDALPVARGELDLALRVLRQTSRTGSMHLDDLRAPVLLRLLTDLARERPQLLDGAVRVLERSDRERGTDYLTTLRAYLDAGDVRAAADRVGIHPNTFRYRLRRLSELADLDLDDPEQRLVVHLQLHLLGGPA